MENPCLFCVTVCVNTSIFIVLAYKIANFGSVIVVDFRPNEKPPYDDKVAFLYLFYSTNAPANQP
jgi:hypothetical protein